LIAAPLSCEAIELGHRFYTIGLESGYEANVELWGNYGITTSADRQPDNNLDNLRACSWS
jgi:hypothetical protein